MIDSALTLEEALEGKSIPDDIRATLRITDVRYRSFDGLIHAGQLVVHESVVEEVEEIFEELLALSFPIQQVRPVSVYGWDDETSMAANNSSAFNYRTIAGTDRLSNHSYGLAIDINPFLNPYEQFDGKIVPAGSSYDPSKPGTVTAGSAAVNAFTSRGWRWLGERAQNKDLQHFDKNEQR